MVQPTRSFTGSGVVVTVRELSTGREYNTHHDRLSNPLFSGKEGEPEPEPEHDQMQILRKT